MEDATALGLIPAHAGKTDRPCRSGRKAPAHPRSRGENAGRTVDVLVAPGSSPLTRGKHTAVASERPQLGLIPAHAGKTGPQSCIL